jgi:hypothetical protein
VLFEEQGVVMNQQRPRLIHQGILLRHVGTLVNHLAVVVNHQARRIRGAARSGKTSGVPIKSSDGLVNDLCRVLRHVTTAP